MKNTDKKSKEAIELKDGAIVDAQIKNFKLGDYFRPKIENGYISPASLDLICGEERYRVARMTLPNKTQTIRDIFNTMGATKVSESSKKYIIEKNVKHLISLGKITKPLPHNIWAHISPKSSTGRVDVHVKLMADGVPMYDTLPEGFTGEIWLLVIAQSFPVIIPLGETLSQIRFYRGKSRTNIDDFLNLIDQGLVKDRKGKFLGLNDFQINRNRRSLTMTLDLSVKNPGYVCRGTSQVLDLSKRNEYNPNDFFEKVEIKNGGLELEPGAFYILSTKEILDIPGTIAGEMEVSSYKLGEFRAHYAGFFDPGFRGFGTLEVRSNEELFVYDGYPITEMIFEKTSQVPEVLYGDKKTVHYQGQVGPTLSKHFKK
jgi:dCTP deaminase